MDLQEIRRATQANYEKKYRQANDDAVNSIRIAVSVAIELGKFETSISNEDPYHCDIKEIRRILKPEGLYVVSAKERRYGLPRLWVYWHKLSWWDYIAYWLFGTLGD